MKKFVAIGLIAGMALTQGLAAEEHFSLDKGTPAQKEAISAIEKLGGIVAFSHHVVEKQGGKIALRQGLSVYFLLLGICF